MEIKDVHFKSFLATYDLILKSLFIKYHWFISHRMHVLTQHQTKANVRIKNLNSSTCLEGEILYQT